MFTILLTAAIAAPNPARAEKPSAVGLMVLPRPADVPAVSVRPDPTLTPLASLTGTEFPVLKELPGRVMLRNKGQDVWVSRTEILTAKEAIELYGTLIASSPQVNHYVRRAKAHELALDWDAAIKDYDEAIRLGPQISAYWNNRANYYSRKREYQKALDGYDEAVRLTPTSFIPLGNRGNVFLNTREWDKALEAYDRALKVNGTYSRSYAGKSTAYREKRRYDLALKEAERAMELEPTSPHSLLARGLAFAALKEQDKAFADFEEALRFDPLFGAAYFGRAGVYLARKDYQPAIRDLDTAIRLSPKYSAAMVRRAEAWKACGNPHRALADLKEAIVVDDLFPPAYRDLAWILATHPEASIRDGKTAVEMAKKATELAKTPTPEYWETLAAAYAETGDFTSAIDWQKKALADAAYVKEKGESVQKRLDLYESKKAFRE